MIVLDTHAWIWWTSAPDRLSNGARRAIDEATALGVSVISCWEVAMLVTKGRLGLDRGVDLWVRQALARPRVRLLEITPKIAVQAAELKGKIPGDPADRLITATSLARRAALITRDRILTDYSELRTVW